MSLARHGEGKACLSSSAVHLSVDHPLFDRISVKPVVAADPESGNLTVPNQSAHCGQTNV